MDWNGSRIIFVTDNIPFEDMLRIYIFDANMVLVDAAIQPEAVPEPLRFR